MRLKSRAFVAAAAAALFACGAIAPVQDASTSVDASSDTSDAIIDATLDVEFDVGIVDAASDVAVDAADESFDASPESAADADADVYFNAIPDASGCTYYSDASCTTIPKPVSISIGCVSSPPTPLGGTIQPGVYHLTHVDWNAQYFDGSCPQNSTWGGSLEICGNIMQDYDVNDVHSVFVGNLVYQTTGAQLELNQYCPSGPYFASFGYTATSTEITINWSAPVVLVETFTKQ